MNQLFLDLKKFKISFTVSFRKVQSLEEYEVITFSYITLLLLYFLFK